MKLIKVLVGEIPYVHDSTTIENNKGGPVYHYKIKEDAVYRSNNLTNSLKVWIEEKWRPGVALIENGKFKTYVYAEEANESKVFGSILDKEYLPLYFPISNDNIYIEIRFGESVTDEITIVESRYELVL